MVQQFLSKDRFKKKHIDSIQTYARPKIDLVRQWLLITALSDKKEEEEKKRTIRL